MQKKHIVFLHPDLGIGGAERLVVDAAVGLQRRGHAVTVFTAHRDPAHCFDEARNGTLDVRVRGNSLFPATLFGRGRILFAILRQLHLLLVVYLSGELPTSSPPADNDSAANGPSPASSTPSLSSPKPAPPARPPPTGPPDAFVLDQLAAGLPLLRRLYPRAPALFYCHFPDLHLARGRRARWKRAWRAPFDALEGRAMRAADRVVVNSRFTRAVVRATWGAAALGDVGVVYPCVPDESAGEGGEERGKGLPLWGGKALLLSINRFERKKDVGLALRAFARLDPAVRERARLVVAGGYDPRVPENVAYHAELTALADSLSLAAATAASLVSALALPRGVPVVFLRSVPAPAKRALLGAARLLVYTPAREHFGIVPLEAMAAGVPVLAADSGGPRETVVEGTDEGTGWLRDPEDVDGWSEVMRAVVEGEEGVGEMGRRGRERVRREFSRERMVDRLEEEMEGMMGRPRKEVVTVPGWMLGTASVLLAIAVVVVSMIIRRVLL